jgi:hypothetical protein
MSELLRNVLAVAFIVAGSCLLGFLIWVAATSKTFLAVSVTVLSTAEVALVSVMGVLAVLDVFPWWAALLIGLIGSVAFVLALPPIARFGLAKMRGQLREAFPEHWREGEAKGRMSVERLATLPATQEEARSLHYDLARLAEEAHLLPDHEDSEGGCLTFRMGFTQGFSASLRSSGFAVKRPRRRA